MIGEQVGSYRVTGLIGGGGMGVVYLAEHPLIGKRAAVKVLLPHLSHDRSIVTRFFNEARAAATIKHAGIVSVIDFGYLANGQAFLIMEHLEGETLGGRLEREGPLAEVAAVRLVSQVARAVSAAHAKGIVHRDLKPENIFVVPDAVAPDGERVKILDFGIAKLTETSGVATGSSTGNVVGSPHYMAPEQCRGGGDVDARADIYSLGCVLFELVTGQPPFDGTGAGDIIAQHIYQPPPTVRSRFPGASRALDALVQRMLAKDRTARPQSMDALAAELDELGAGPLSPERAARRPSHPSRDTTLASAASEVRGPRRRGRLWLAGVATLLVAGALGLAFVARGRDAPATDTPPPVRAPAPTVTPMPIDPPPAPTATAADDAGALAAAAAAPEVTLAIASSPGGATVYRQSDGARLGVTPFTGHYQRAAGAMDFVLRKGGYRPERITMPIDHDGSASVSLRPIPAADPLDPYAK